MYCHTEWNSGHTHLLYILLPIKLSIDYIFQGYSSENCIVFPFNVIEAPCTVYSSHLAITHKRELLSQTGCKLLNVPWAVQLVLKSSDL